MAVVTNNRTYGAKYILFSNNSKTVEFRKILVEINIVHHQKTDLRRNFQNYLLPVVGNNVGIMATEIVFFCPVQLSEISRA